MNTVVPEVRLRNATPQDALCVGVLASQVFLDTYATEGVRADLAAETLEHYSPAAFAARLRTPGTHFILAEKAGYLLAFAETVAQAAAPHPSLTGGMELVRLYVQRHFQRQGVGQLLLRRAEERARHLGAPCLWLTAWSGNTNARAFYAAQGYVDIGATTYALQGEVYENRIFSKAMKSVP